MIRPLATYSLTLIEVAKLVNAELVNSSDEVITGVSLGDKEVESGDLFVAIPGANVHGAKFIESARGRGAVAMLTDSAGAEFCTGFPTLIVNDVRIAAAAVSSSLYKNPTRDLSSIGVTGTNGKTTVTMLLHQIFTAAHRDSGLIGTVETRIGSEVLKSSRTTPEAPELQSLTAVMRERHMRHLVMEVSSHAIALNRIKGSHFGMVGFTNLSQDHLDFHGDIESYYQVKAKLFTHEYADRAFINIDSEYGARLAKECSISVTPISHSNPKAEWHFTEIHGVSKGYEIKIRGTGGVLIESKTSLVGAYNLDNLLMAVAIAHESGVDLVELATIIPSLLGAPGRLDSVDIGQNFAALVDYAHSPDAVTNVLKAAREFTSGRIIAVLGCGGDRDSSKRSLMGKALAEGSDVAVFTSDNPRSEKPADILKAMTSGITINSPSTVIEDRARAIEYAVNLAEKTDTVLILGKGHETGQELNGVVTAFDDRLQLARAIEKKK
ncbi:MAG: UDP-N-acetylmuramoyl-L-alanyl-D-glutamate--2,6-diaminopimelate ligase [Actinobacteria bacterium]|nr:UDP-N-acetylmuramoyl-L-alanyl-D-glutamate--2,6-diaminopimelate ligase [Actinomycetota bacterium]